VPLASVYPLVTSRAVARPFTYEVPDGVGRGAVVAIRFGRAAGRGVVVETGVEAPPGVTPARVGEVLYELPPALVELALWVADYYGSTPARSLELVAPKLRARRGERRRTAPGMAGEAAPAALTEPQRAAVARIGEALESGGAHLLLAGATGSGKTEVYLQACASALERGRGAIVLVPEIALTPQTLGRFQARFGDRIAVLHSGLTEAERRDERERIAGGEAPIVVGARSAVFAPVPRGMTSPASSPRSWGAAASWATRRSGTSSRSTRPAPSRPRPTGSCASSATGSQARICWGRRRCCGCAAGTARSSWPRRSTRARSRPPPRACSPPPRRRCAAPG
jgi:primosomal protein N'